MALLVLLRHGESQWNLENRFTGWVDVPLTDKGRDEARRAGEKIRHIHVDKAHHHADNDIHKKSIALSCNNSTVLRIIAHRTGSCCCRDSSCSDCNLNVMV